MMGLDGMDSRNSERDGAGYIFPLRPNGHEQPVLRVQCNGIPKYCWTSLGNAGHVWNCTELFHARYNTAESA